MPVGDNLGVEKDESVSDETSDDAELILSVRCNATRAIGLKERAASCSIADGDWSNGTHKHNIRTYIHMRQEADSGTSTYLWRIFQVSFTSRPGSEASRKGFRKVEPSARYVVPQRSSV